MGEWSVTGSRVSIARGKSLRAGAMKDASYSAMCVALRLSERAARIPSAAHQIRTR